MAEYDFMLEAVNASAESIDTGGGPFGAVIVKNNRIIAYGNNTVTKSNDPTAHAEVNAIRKACQNLGTFNLSGCTIYTSCEPCPMCLAAIYWARIDKIYYANTRTHAREIGFDDEFMYTEIARPIEERKIEAQRIIIPQALSVFKKWQTMENKIEY